MKVLTRETFLSQSLSHCVIEPLLLHGYIGPEAEFCCEESNLKITLGNQ